MTTRFGGLAQWQAHRVHEWIKQVVQLEDASLVVLDGQACPTVIRDAANQMGFFALHITERGYGSY